MTDFFTYYLKVASILFACEGAISGILAPLEQRLDLVMIA
jgi:hypothetical protein